jgi:hypothetical protein
MSVVYVVLQLFCIYSLSNMLDNFCIIIIIIIIVIIIIIIIIMSITPLKHSALICGIFVSHYLCLLMV